MFSARPYSCSSDHQESRVFQRVLYHCAQDRYRHRNGLKGGRSNQQDRWLAMRCFRTAVVVSPKVVVAPRH
jgi:hypothetical protein